MQTDKLGLAEYLPQDIENFHEIPYGMEDTVANIRSRRANARARAEREKAQQEKAVARVQGETGNAVARQD